MASILDIVLLLALPASGKSEVRKYLKHLSAEECAKDFHMGPTVQLDDFPYVHLMRRIDDELVVRGQPRVYFHAPDRSFRDPRHWGTLIELVNEDYDDIVERRMRQSASAARWLLERLDAAARAVGAQAPFGSIAAGTLDAVAEALEKEARELLDEKNASLPDTLAGKTVVIEFARGGPDQATQPLSAPFGYEYSLGRLSEKILSRAVILYVWVTPTESRRKNAERADPNDPGSILHHSVPLSVMLNDYGCDDMDWLEVRAKRAGTVTVEAHGRTFDIPLARFDNRVDKTSFIRKERAAWTEKEIAAVHEGLRTALERLTKLRG